MKKKQIGMLGVCVLAAMLFCGCNTTNVSVVDPNEVKVSQNGVQISAIEVKPAHVKPIRVDESVPLNNGTLTVLHEYRDKLRLNISGEGATTSERRLADRLAFQATSGVADDIASVVTDQRLADVVLRIKPNLTTIDHDGNYWRMNCEIFSELRGYNMTRVFAAKSFQFVSPQRVLGQEKAESQFDAEGGKAITAWCAEELRKVFDREIGVCQIAISLPGQRDPVKDDQSIQRIGSQIRRIKGLVSYELAGKDAEKGICIYRLVYYRSYFQNGVSTEVSAALNAVAKHK